MSRGILHAHCYPTTTALDGLLLALNKTVFTGSIFSNFAAFVVVDGAPHTCRRVVPCVVLQAGERGPPECSSRSLRAMQLAMNES